MGEFMVELNSSIEDFVERTFGPWARSRAQELCQGQSPESLRAVGWLVCNEGEGFGLAQPFLEVPRLIDGLGEAVSSEDGLPSPWTEVMVVCDMAKSSETDVAVEVFKLPGTATTLPERLLFDVRNCSRAPVVTA